MTLKFNGMNMPVNKGKQIKEIVTHIPTSGIIIALAAYVIHMQQMGYSIWHLAIKQASSQTDMWMDRETDR